MQHRLSRLPSLLLLAALTVLLSACGDSTVAVAPEAVDAGCAGELCGTTCTDVQADPNDCGRCGNDCTALPGVDASRVGCVQGACVIADACAPDRADCNDSPVDGCERDVAKDGSCGLKCDAGTHRCGEECVADTDVAHCGGSCSPCVPPANAVATCDGIRCGFACDPGYHLAVRRA